MKENIEFPEGVTQIEAATAAMKFIVKLNELKETLEGTGSEDGGTPDATKAPAGGTGVDILAENFVVTESYSGYDGTYIAKVQNNTGSPLSWSSTRTRARLRLCWSAVRSRRKAVW